MKQFYKACERMVQDDEFKKLIQCLTNDSNIDYHVGTIEEIDHDEKLFKTYLKKMPSGGYKIPLVAQIQSVGVMKSLLFYLEGEYLK